MHNNDDSDSENLDMSPQINHDSDFGMTAWAGWLLTIYVVYSFPFFFFSQLVIFIFLLSNYFQCYPWKDSQEKKDLIIMDSVIKRGEIQTAAHTLYLRLAVESE